MEVVAAILVNKEDEILIARKKAGKSLAGLYEFPGGKIETGETPEEALIRELKEEMNLQISIGEYFDTNIHAYGDKTIKLIAYFGTIVGGELKLKDHDEVGWVTRQELGLYDFAPADVPFVDRLKSSTLPLFSS